MKKLVFILILIITTVPDIFSQYIFSWVISPGGDYGSTSEYNLSWTLGELMPETYISDNITLTQGFQQPDLIKSTYLQNDQFNFTVNTYPNPVINDLIIDFEGLRDTELLYISVMDIMGRILILNKLKELPETCQFKLNMENLHKGIYFLKIYTPDCRIYKLFKIEKQ